MRTFITFAAGETYEKLSEVLKDSINSFSEYDLIIYKLEDFDTKFSTDLTYQITIYKILDILPLLYSNDIDSFKKEIAAIR